MTRASEGRKSNEPTSSDTQARENRHVVTALKMFMVDWPKKGLLAETLATV